MKGKYKRKKGWCDNCDSEIVEGGKKCDNCGIRNYAAKIKKPNTKEILYTETRQCDCFLNNDKCKCYELKK